MLDSDLGRLYNVETKRINEAVSRNKEKFPERFCFKISEAECNVLKSQIATSKGGSRKGHAVFTESGVAMLATILKSKIAIEVSISIMDAFVKMRHFINENKDIYVSLTNINNKLIDHDEKFEYIFSKFDRKEQLFISGQTYDAISYIVDVLQSATNELIIIDPYADKVLLDLLRNVNCNIVTITKNKRISETEINRFNEQYNNLKVTYNDTFHDRYFVIDRKTIYHCGTSLNHAGSKTFSINLINDKVILETLLKRINF